ncbi:MAG: inorganic diphosphatase [Myxococcota bacterium]
MSAASKVTVEIEVGRGGFVKRTAGGLLDYVSPVPCPFNYGCVPDRIGGDGDPLDAVVLGPGLMRGQRVDVEIYGVIRFVDAGRVDDKLVCSTVPPTDAERLLVTGFFTAYARAKSVLNRARGLGGETRMVGWDPPPLA